MNNYPLLQYISLFSKNLLLQFGNSVTFGIPEALKDSTNEIYLQSKLTNEGLYYLQVKTFLETLDLNEDEVEKFMTEHPSHERLGFEIFKILENTILEHQARMVARSFQLLTQKQISTQDFDKYTYIITKLNKHLIYLINSLIGIPKYDGAKEYEANHSIVSSIAGKINIPLSNPNLDLVSFGFLETEVITDTFGTRIGNSADYILTQDFYEFYEKVFKD